MDELEELIDEIEDILRKTELFIDKNSVKRVWQRLLDALNHLLVVATDIVEFEQITREVKEFRKNPPTEEERLKIKQILEKAQTDKE